MVMDRNKELDIELISSTRLSVLNELLFIRLEPFFKEEEKGSRSNQILLEPQKVLKMVPRKGSV